MKKIFLLGATGRTGKAILTLALKRGYSVTALVRDPEKIDVEDANLNLIVGSPHEWNDVRKGIIGCNAVLVALNNTRKSDMPWASALAPPDVICKSVQLVLKAMRESGVRRIVTLSAFGVGNSFYLSPWLTRFFIRKTNLSIAYRDHEATEALLRASYADWTSVRPVALTNSDNQREAGVSYNTDLPLSATISRKQVARFMLDIIDNSYFFEKTPAIRGK